MNNNNSEQLIKAWQWATQTETEYSSVAAEGATLTGIGSKFYFKRMLPKKIVSLPHLVIFRHLRLLTLLPAPQTSLLLSHQYIFLANPNK